MHAVQVRELKNNPSQALRKAEHDMVVVMNRDHPSALLLHFDEAILQKAGVSVALATALFRDGGLSLARAAKVAGMPIVDFMQHLSRLGIAVVQGTVGDAEKDLETLETWLKES
jgi:predicted HTH domain antitoxin